MNLSLFDFIYGWIGLITDDGTPDGAYWAMHEDAVEAYNQVFGTGHDWFDIQVEYVEWSNRQGCETYNGTGEIDETLSGEPTSDQHAPCPDCTKEP